MIDTMLRPIKSLFGLNLKKLKSGNVKKDSDKFNPTAETRNGILSAEDIYTPLSVAKEEIWRRWNDKELRKKVEIFLNGDIPEFFITAPHNAIVRHLISPNYEFLYFMDLVKQTGMGFKCFEFSRDRFVAKNRDKYNLCRMSFFNGTGKNSYEIIDVRKIVDIPFYEGKMFCDIKTLWGEDLVGFHHRMLASVFPEARDNIFDVSSWFMRKGSDPKKFYLFYLALFICHGILFENFSSKEDMGENNFNKEVVFPAIRELVGIFGLKPLIVPVVPIENEQCPHWWHYPSSIKELFN